MTSSSSERPVEPRRLCAVSSNQRHTQTQNRAEMNQQKAVYYQQQQNLTCDPAVLQYAVSANAELDQVRSQATDLFCQALVAVDNANRERDLAKGQAQMLFSEAHQAVNEAQAQTQEREQMLIVAKSQFEQMQLQMRQMMEKIRHEEERNHKCFERAFFKSFCVKAIMERINSLGVPRPAVLSRMSCPKAPSMSKRG